MIGKDRAVRAALARVVRHGNQVSAILVSALDGDVVQRAQRGGEIEMTALETAVEFLAARINSRCLLRGEIDHAIVVAARDRTRAGLRHRFIQVGAKPHDADNRPARLWFQDRKR